MIANSRVVDIFYRCNLICGHFIPGWIPARVLQREAIVWEKDIGAAQLATNQVQISLWSPVASSTTLSACPKTLVRKEKEKRKLFTAQSNLLSQKLTSSIIGLLENNIIIEASIRNAHFFVLLLFFSRCFIQPLKFSWN